MCVNTWKLSYIDHNSDADGHIHSLTSVLQAKGIIKMFVKKKKKSLQLKSYPLPGKWKNT